MTTGFDALILTQMQNLLTSKELSDAGIFSSYSHAPGWPTTFAGEETYLDDDLKQSTLKRGCCLNHNADATYSVSVKIPIPSKDEKGATYAINPNVLINNKYPEKLGYIDHPVQIPKSICDANFPLYKHNTDKCYNFMQLYCNNMKKIFKKAIDYPTKPMDVDKFNDNFALYSPECGCYGDLDPANIVQGAFGNNCFMQHCKYPNAFKDLSSVADCSGTFCTNILNVTGNKAGGNINITPSMVNSCPNIKKDIGKKEFNIAAADDDVADKAAADKAAADKAVADKAASAYATPADKAAAAAVAAAAADKAAAAAVAAAAADKAAADKAAADKAADKTAASPSIGNMVLGSEELVKGFSNTILLFAGITILIIIIYFVTKKK